MSVEFVEIECDQDYIEEVVMANVVNFKEYNYPSRVEYRGIISNKVLATYSKINGIAKVPKDFVESYDNEVWED